LRINGGIVEDDEEERRNTGMQFWRVFMHIVEEGAFESEIQNVGKEKRQKREKTYKLLFSL